MWSVVLTVRQDELRLYYTMRSSFGCCTNPPFRACQSRRVNFELITPGNVRRGCLELRDVRAVSKLSLEIAPQDCATGHGWSKFRDEFRRTLGEDYWFERLDV